MEIRAHRLFDEQQAIPFKGTPNHSGIITPEYLIIHFTKGASASSSINWLTNPDAKASAHLVIAKDGAVTQLVDFNRRAWHAGRSRWENRVGLNTYSIGIELDNYGDLIGEPGNWKTGWGHAVDDSEVVRLPHKYDGKERGWNFYPEPQLDATLKVAQLLMKEYNLKNVLGHDDIAPGRKLDPGPAFPMDSFRSALLGRSDDDEEIYHTTTALNIRSGPGSQYDKLAVSPLPQGTPLEVSREEGLWREVTVLKEIQGEMDIVGWVHHRYIQHA